MTIKEENWFSVTDGTLRVRILHKMTRNQVFAALHSLGCHIVN